MTEYWTVGEVAGHLGITENAARGQLSRWGIKGAVRYPADDVRTAHAQRPGRGARTDIKEYAVTVKTTLIDADAAFTEALGETPRTYAWAAGQLGSRTQEPLKHLMDALASIASGQTTYWNIRWDGTTEEISDLEWERTGTLTVWSHGDSRALRPRLFEVQIAVAHGETAPTIWYGNGTGTARVLNTIYTGRSVANMVASLLPVLVTTEFTLQACGSSFSARLDEIPTWEEISERWETYKAGSDPAAFRSIHGDV